MTIRNLHYVAIGCSIGLIAVGAAWVCGGVGAGYTMVVAGFICGSSATAAVRGKG